MYRTQTDRRTLPPRWPGTTRQYRTPGNRCKTYRARLKEPSVPCKDFLYPWPNLRAPLRALSAFTRFLPDTQVSRLDAEGRDYADRMVTSRRSHGPLIRILLAYGRLGPFAAPAAAW